MIQTAAFPAKNFIFRGTAPHTSSAMAQWGEASVVARLVVYLHKVQDTPYIICCHQLKHPMASQIISGLFVDRRPSGNTSSSG